ncbi:MAG: hypothetical protein UT55_C0021G0004 [Candidatus Peregrinibacteria bacterium GW2011_GWE2_39_6]|nr:MAG: hypothetical protein UT36_C0007G0039 [Candidatus Peregrinibacteria bacterium GW2011_GWF2_39_17]KKR26006.1 MAG: hypothetical protein UT55_C0021G0004 [Candidatus Peregrinibacteria bacterium GW2011_GWE2_39_6]HCW31894.1 hypothetical protein [Candidatus Peregrinibacteria bacterium]
MSKPRKLNTTSFNYQQAVLKTLAYFNLFQYPLTIEEIENYLLVHVSNYTKIRSILNSNKNVVKNNLFYQLKNAKNYAITRQDRAKIAQKMWGRIHRYQWIFNLIPYLRLVAVCNNLAYNNPTAKSDIDLLIITKSGRLFTARLLLTFWLHILGVRRHGKKITGRFCLSFFITENQLNLSSIRIQGQDIYLAYWLRTLQPISGSINVYEQFLKANSKWLKEFFAQPLLEQKIYFRSAPPLLIYLKNLGEKIFDSKGGQWLENRLATWQLKRANQKKQRLKIPEKSTAIILSRDILKFHNNDQRKNLADLWQNWTSIKK